MLGTRPLYTPIYVYNSDKTCFKIFEEKLRKDCYKKKDAFSSLFIYC